MGSLNSIASCKRKQLSRHACQTDDCSHALTNSDLTGESKDGGNFSPQKSRTIYMQNRARLDELPKNAN